MTVRELFTNGDGMATYPEAVNLPFNGHILRKEFIPATPGENGGSGPGPWIMLQGGAMVLQETDAGPALHGGERPSWAEGAETLYLGKLRGKPLRALLLSRHHEPPPSFVRETFNAEFQRIDDLVLTLGGYAQQIFTWQKKCSVCSLCGGAVEPIPGTWGKRCVSCGYDHFPHINPCVIVLVKRGREFILARKPSWPKGRFSLVAGFVDFGESLEECVEREVREEVGVEVTNIRYVGSQNWPFPSQLMAGFVADYAGGEVMADNDEIEAAAWFSPERLPDSLPAKRSIARWIIERYGLGT